ncbi:MAG: C45 family peptidase [Myxococcota bacterium]
MKAYAFQNTSAREIGLEHGEVFRDSVRAMASIRMDLVLGEPAFGSKEQVLDLATQHLPILEAYDLDLYHELLGIADGAGVTPEEIVVLNHYTDLRDIGGCTMVFVPSPTGNLLGQTWDIDASALPHTLLLQFKDALVLSVAGCLGLTGFNSQGVGICINNLSSLDARVGLVWPALVRRVLRARSAKEGSDLVMNAPLGSGHHYAVGDKSDFFGIETSGTRKKLVQHGTDKPHFHTNHCLDQEIAEVSTVRTGSTTYHRYNTTETGLSQQVPQDLKGLWKALAAVSMEPGDNAVATCGAMAMNLTTGEWHACQGPARAEDI